MNPKQFLLIGGIILVVVGLAGFVVLGPGPGDSVFGENWWFDNGENAAHLLFGVVALVAAFALAAELQGWLTLLVGILGLLVMTWGWFVGPNLWGANLENPLDNVLHLAVGAWALWAWWSGRKVAGEGSMMSSGSSM